MVNYRDVKELIDLMRDTDVVEIEVERGGGRVRIRRETGSAPAASPGDLARQAAPVPAPATTGPAPVPPPPAAPAGNVVTVTAPLVGRFYRAPSPDAPAYVEVGDRVRKGQVICIIEAMKLMNEIEAESAGVVRAILAESGTAVEFGAPLFEIERADQ